MVLLQVHLHLKQAILKFYIIDNNHPGNASGGWGVGWGLGCVCVWGGGGGVDHFLSDRSALASQQQSVNTPS